MRKEGEAQRGTGGERRAEKEVRETKDKRRERRGARKEGETERGTGGERRAEKEMSETRDKRRERRGAREMREESACIA